MSDTKTKTCPKCSKEISFLNRTHWGHYQASSQVDLEGEEIVEESCELDCDDDEYACPECCAYVKLSDFEQYV